MVWRNNEKKTTLILISFLIGFPSPLCFQEKEKKYGDQDISDFCEKLKPIGRILETEGYYVWGISPIYGDDGKVHVFYSRWPSKYGMGGWIHQSEIAHAVADTPEGPYTFLETVLDPRPGYWDATTCHNPHVQKIDNKYYLFYMGNSNGKTDTKRIGLAVAASLNGPWIRADKPLLEPGKKGEWDDHCTTNPAFLKHPNGQCWLYYKSWNDEEYRKAKGSIRGNRKYGLAVSEKPEGPYVKHERNPILDFSKLGNNRQAEDAYVWFENQKFKMVLRDMGIFCDDVGLYIESEDGIVWGKPKIAWREVKYYVAEAPPSKSLTRYGRFERPQLLLKNGHPVYMFNATQGGKYQTSSGFLFKIEE
jgi:hypothetical protein